MSSNDRFSLARAAARIARAVGAQLGLLVPALAITCACNRPSSSSHESSGPTQAELKREHVYVLRCAPCHGRSGAGDGTLSGRLEPRPRDLRDPAWLGSVTDEYLKQIIVEGGAGVGKSAAMPANPDLATNAVELANLVATLRALKDKPR